MLQGQLRADRDALAGGGAGGRHGRRAHALLWTRSSSSRKLDRELEALPTDEQLAERKPRGQRADAARAGGGCSPTARSTCTRELLDSDLPEDPHLSAELERYFPAPLPQRFAEQIREHRLRREIIATQVINNMEHGGGITFAFRLHEESGAPASEIARAYAAARDIFAMRTQWAEIEALDNKVAAEVQMRMLLEGRRLVERGSRWLLAHRAPAARHRHDRALLLAGRRACSRTR